MEAQGADRIFRRSVLTQRGMSLIWNQIQNEMM